MATCVEEACRNYAYRKNGYHRGAPNVYVRHDNWLR
jgi:hypothetical protein